MQRERPGSVVVVRRHLLRDRSAVVAHGDFTPLFEEFLAHARRWEMDVDPLSGVMMRQALGGAGLQLAFRKQAESMAWTVNVPEPPRNLFVVGRAGEGALTGRVFTEGIKTGDGARMHVEAVRRNAEPSRTWVDVEGLDLLVMYQQYFERSEQIPTRFFELEHDLHMTMVQALPGADSQWVRDVTREEIGETLARSPEVLDTHEVHLHCGCTGEKIATALATFWRDDPEALFQGEPGVETLCPRCGVHWWIERALYEARRH